MSGGRPHKNYDCSIHLPHKSSPLARNYRLNTQPHIPRSQEGVGDHTSSVGNPGLRVSHKLHRWLTNRKNIPTAINRAPRIPTINEATQCRRSMGFDPAPFCAAPTPNQKKRLPIDGFPRWREGTCSRWFLSTAARARHSPARGVLCSHLAASRSGFQPLAVGAPGCRVVGSPWVEAVNRRAKMQCVICWPPAFSRL